MTLQQRVQVPQARGGPELGAVIGSPHRALAPGLRQIGDSGVTALTGAASFRLLAGMRAGLILVAGCIALLVAMLLSAASDPVVRRYHYRPAQWPAGAPPMRLVLLTDTHVSGPDTPPARLKRIVETINGLGPDLVLLGGDYVSAKKIATRRYGAAEAIRPLASLKASSGVIAVLGNHDHWDDGPAIERELARAGITVLDNTAVRKGPLAIGGVDDDFTGHAKLAAVAAKLASLGGVPILLTHSPDVFPEVPAGIGLVLAGHTHCGQIRLPVIGAPATMSRYGQRFLCGVVADGERRLIVSAGVGTSILPLRLNAPPDLWVVEVGP